MDIAARYNYEKLFRLDLVFPDTEEPSGIVFQIRSASSEEAKKIARKHVDQIGERTQRGKLIKGKMRMDQELEKAASWIASWDWGTHTYADLGVPEHTFKNAVRILDEQDWIFEAVSREANKIGNFTNAPENGVDGTSS